MSDNEQLDQEPEETKSTKSLVSPKTRKSFSKVRRELTEEELSSTAVQRLLLEDIERLEEEKIELLTYREQYYQVDKKAAVLDQIAKKSIASDIVFAVCLCVGAAALGYAPSVWNAQPSGYIAIAFGLILIICGIVSRLVQR
jgi:hypothetical protein